MNRFPSRCARRLGAAAFVASSAAVSAAEVTPTLTVAIQEGDAVAGVGLVTTIDAIAVNDSGTWVVESDTDNANTNADGVVVRSGVLASREGDALADPPGSSIGSYGSGGAPIDSSGRWAWNYFLDGMTSTTDSGIFLDNTLVIQESDVSGAPQLSAGTPYIGFWGAKLNDAGEVLIMASVDDPAISSTVDRALVIATIDTSTGALLSESVLAKEGDLLPGQTETVADFLTGPHAWTISSSGSVMYVADLNGSTAADGAIYVDTTLVAQEGSPSPVAGRTYVSLGSSRVALNGAGDHAFTATLSGTTSDDAVIVLNGGVFAQEGSTLPSIPGGFLLQGFGTGAIDLDEAGNLFWFGDWDDPDTAKDTGIFRDCQLVVQEGVTTIGGVALESIATVQENFDVSPNGEWLIFEGTLTGGVTGAFLVHMTESSTTYCTAGTTTNGCNATISASGAASAQNLIDYEIRVDGVEGQKSGLVFYGVNGAVANPWGAGSTSFICVAFPIQRTPVQQSGGTADACDGTFVVDWDDYVVNNPGAVGTPFSAGDTVWAQAWFRDPPAPRTTNLSNGLTFTLCN